MSTNQPPTVDAVARALTAIVRVFVAEAMRDNLWMQMQGGEATTNAHARACMGCRFKANAEFTLSGVDREHRPGDTCSD